MTHKQENYSEEPENKATTEAIRQKATDEATTELGDICLQNRQQVHQNDRGWTRLTIAAHNEV